MGAPRRLMRLITCAYFDRDSVCSELSSLRRFSPRCVRNCLQDARFNRFIIHAAENQYVQLLTLLCEKGIPLLMSPNRLCDHLLSNEEKFLIRCGLPFPRTENLLEHISNVDDFVKDKLLCSRREWERGAGHVNEADTEGWSPLLLAAHYQLPDIALALLRRGADPYAVNCNGHSVTQVAILSQCRDIIDMLLHRYNIDFFSRGDSQALRPFDTAVLEGDLQTVTTLLPGCDINMKCPDGFLPLHHAVKDSKMVKLLLENDALVDALSLDGSSALHLAARYGHLSSCRVLISYSASLSLADHSGFQPVHLAAFHGHTHVLRFLIDSQCDCVLARDALGRTPLHLAVLNNKLRAVRELIYSGAEINAVFDDDHISPLHIALHDTNSEDLALLLLDAGSCVSSAVARLPGVPSVLNLCLQLVRELSCGVDLDCDQYSDVPAGFRFKQGLKASHSAIVLDVHESIDSASRQLLISQVPNGSTIYQMICVEGELSEECSVPDIQLALRQAIHIRDFDSLESLPVFRSDQVWGFLHNHILNDLLVTAVRQGESEILSLLWDRGFLLPFDPCFLCEDHSLSGYDTLELLIRTGAPGDPIIIPDGVGNPDFFIQRRLELAIDAWRSGASDVNQRDDLGWTPAMFSCTTSFCTVFDILCELNADLGLANSESETVLHMAVMSGSLPFVEHVLNLMTRSVYQPFLSSALCVSISERQFDISGLLVRQGADPFSVVAGSEWSPCSLAAHHCFYDLIIIFFEICFDSRVLGFGRSYVLSPAGMRRLLRVAISDDCFRLFETLTRFLDCSDLRFEEGRTPLFFANTPEMCHFLMDRGYSCFDSDNLGFLPIHLAVMNGHDSVVEVLLPIVGINVGGPQGRSLLHFAARYGSSTTCQLLINAGADMRSRCGSGIEPLHSAAFAGQEDVVRLFLADISCDVNCRTRSGQTPLWVAASCGFLSTCVLLVETYKAGFHCDSSFTLPIHIASANGHSSIVRYFVSECHCDINSLDGSGRTPLIRAITSGHTETASVLLELGADVTITSNENRSALSYAILNESVADVTLLVSEGAFISDDCLRLNRECGELTGVGWFLARCCEAMAVFSNGGVGDFRRYCDDLGLPLSFMFVVCIRGRCQPLVMHAEQFLVPGLRDRLIRRIGDRDRDWYENNCY